MQPFYTSLSDKVYKRLLSDIISGRISAGEKVGEELLSAKMRVSRTPVREAIHRLTQEGLIERIPRCGCFVKKQNRNEIRELFECRQVLECAALEMGFSNIPKERLSAMSELIEDIEKMNLERQVELSLKLDDILHSLIVEICPNELMKKMLLKLQQQCMPFRTFRSLNAEEISNVTSERVCILRALVAGDKEASVRLLKTHIQAGEEIGW
jgi:DNA-binding GntR family transcriptional regulator